VQDVDALNAPHAGLSLGELGDEELLALARRDDQEAYAALFTRYSYAAHRLARHLGQRDEAEDVVAEAFAQVLDLVRRGKGPDRAFRAYLFTTIRHEAARRARSHRRIVPTDDDDQIDTIVPFGGGELDEFEKSAIRAAYESLPERWRTVLWHLDVEGLKPHELGPLLGLSSNSVSALVYRARSGLREAYLHQHVKTEAPAASRACRDVRDKLSSLVRRSSSMREQEKVHAHLQSCRDCMAIYLDLQEVNREVGAIVVPAALAVSLAGAVSAVAAAGGWSGALTNVLIAAKGLLLGLAPPAAAAAITTASLMTLSGADVEVSDPPRVPSASAVSQERTVSRAPEAEPSASESGDKAEESPKALKEPARGKRADKPVGNPVRETQPVRCESPLPAKGRSDVHPASCNPLLHFPG
jgi:RNA polymerase sigma factor (sigma-70 family)